MPPTAGFIGGLKANTQASDANALAYVVRAMVDRVVTIEPVEVVTVTPVGVGSMIGGIVSVLPLVMQVDGGLNAYPHGVVPNLIYLRLQAGGSGIVLDPVVNDNGLALICGRDTTNVRQTGAQAPPGTRRRFDWADGVYLGGVLNGALTQYLQFITGGEGGINLVSPGTITINGVTFDPMGNIASPAGITAVQNVVAGQGGADQVGLQTHKHPTAATGAPSSPTPGT